jgi:hypothetical protein
MARSCDRTFMTGISYIESDVPAEMTLIEWRRTRVGPPRPRRRLRTMFLRRAA